MHFMFIVCSSIVNSPDNLIVLILYPKKTLIINICADLERSGVHCSSVSAGLHVFSFINAYCLYIESSDLGGC
jgi:hypothetical protein